MTFRKWIVGGIGAAGAAGAGAAALLFAPVANAEDVEVGFALQFAEAGQTSSLSGDYRIALGEPIMLFFEDQPLEAQYGLIVSVNACPADAPEEAARDDAPPACDLVWEFEIFEAVEWHKNELGGVSVTQKRVLATPRLTADRHAAVSFDVGSVTSDGAPYESVSGEFTVRAGP